MKPWGSMKLQIYGGSHEKRIGLTMELPKGIRLDGEIISRDIERRRGGGAGATSRRESDAPIYLSGLCGGVTTGETLRVEFENSDVRPEDYQRTAFLPRPSHCDYPAYIKYGSIPPGGGMFSGRMTLPLVFAGAVARQLLLQKGIAVGGHYFRIGGASDTPLDPLYTDADTLARLRASDFPVLNASVRGAMEKRIAEARAAGDSLGGAVELCALGLPVGAGGPLWEGLESSIASIMYAVPGVKGVEFGAGFGFSDMRGSAANDGLRMRDGKIALEGNRSGGINGGMANGAPLLLRAAFRPTPSIALPQHTIDLSCGQNADIAVKGRHDACIALRGLAAAEAALCLGILDCMEGL